MSSSTSVNFNTAGHNLLDALEACYKAEAEHTDLLVGVEKHKAMLEVAEGTGEEILASLKVQQVALEVAATAYALAQQKVNEAQQIHRQVYNAESTSKYSVKWGR